MGKPDGVSNVFFTYFDYFFGGQYKLGGREVPEGVKTSTPPKNRALVIVPYNHEIAMYTVNAKNHL